MPNSVQEITKSLNSALRKNHYPENSLRELLSWILKIDTLNSYLLCPTQNLNWWQQKRYEKALNLVMADCPIAYITKKAYFFAREFYVNRNVLIPRPLTEELVTKVLGFIQRENFNKITLIDIGTGSGCIITTIALELIKHSSPASVQLIATDVSQKALSIARKNLSIHSVDKKVKLFLANCLINLQTSSVVDPSISKSNNSKKGQESIGRLIVPKYKHVIIVTNKPYIPKNDYVNLPSSVKTYEPKLALIKSRKFENTLEQNIRSLQQLGKKVYLFEEDYKDGLAYITSFSIK